MVTDFKKIFDIDSRYWLMVNGRNVDDHWTVYGGSLPSSFVYLCLASLFGLTFMRKKIIVLNYLSKPK